MSELDQFVARFRRLGATDDEVQTLIDNWDKFDDDWTPARRREFVRSSDATILADLRALRREYSAVQGSESGVYSEAARVVDGTVAAVMEWVGTDRARAEAALSFEQMSPDPRSTLVHRLRQIVG